MIASPEPFLPDAKRVIEFIPALADCVDVLTAGFEQGAVLQLLYGESGTGKSAVLSALADRLEIDHTVVTLISTAIDEADVLRCILMGAGVSPSARAADGLFSELRAFAGSRAQSGRPLVVLIDEAFQLDDGGLRRVIDLSVKIKQGDSAVRFVLASIVSIYDRLLEIDPTIENASTIREAPLRTLSDSDAAAYIRKELAFNGIDDVFFPSEMVARTAISAKGVLRLVNRASRSAILRARLEGANHVNLDHVGGESGLPTLRVPEYSEQIDGVAAEKGDAPASRPAEESLGRSLAASPPAADSGEANPTIKIAAGVAVTTVLAIGLWVAILGFPLSPEDLATADSIVSNPVPTVANESPVEMSASSRDPVLDQRVEPFRETSDAVRVYPNESEATSDQPDRRIVANGELPTATLPEELRIAELKDAAETAHSGGDLDGALGLLDEAIVLSGDDAPELVSLRQSWVEEQENALETARRVDELKGTAAVAHAAGDYAGALSYVDEALALSGGQDPALISLRQTWLEAQSAARERSRRIAELKGAAETAHGGGDIDTALASVDEALALSGGQDPALISLRQTWLDEQSAAQERSRRIAELKGAAETAHAGGDLDGALGLLDEAIVLSGEDAPELVSLRQSWVEEQENALETARRVDELKGTAAVAHAAGDYAGALSYVDEALALSGGQDPALISLRQTWLEAQSAARERSRRIAELKEAAETAHGGGDLDGALGLLDEAIVLSGDDAPELVSLRQSWVQEHAVQAQSVDKLENAQVPVQDSEGNTLMGQRFVQRGDDMLDLGDVASARLLYLEAIDLGNVAAATRLGITYDPVSLTQLGITGAATDSGKAVTLYEKAIVAGDQDAVQRLADLKQYMQ